MSRNDWMPSRDADFDRWSNNFVSKVSDYVNGNPPVWTHVPSADFDRLEQLHGGWLLAWEAVQGPHTRPQRIAKNIARREFERFIRYFKNVYIDFTTRVTDIQRAELEVTIRDSVRTMHTEVPEEVENDVQPNGIRTLAVHFKILGAIHHAKPEGYDGAVTIWNVGEEKPMNPEDYTHHEMASRTPFNISFAEEERGSKVWIMQAWQNERGIRGRWSEALFAFIP